SSAASTIPTSAPREADGWISSHHRTATATAPATPRSSRDWGGLCTDPIAVWPDGKAYRFTDNGHYIGHDEPSVKFISNAPGSGNTMTYFMQLAKDPAAPPTATGPAVTDYAELSPAPWFGLPLCDPKSYPQNRCAPDSDTNTGGISDPNAAGSAFMELQFYPPGYQPFIDVNAGRQAGRDPG
ncbi:MAG TPA: hypothetical protein VFL91_20940, partial [Thermomicrobiales bacterium]|nr:hypothetical protein [Thermomicrobiales bacterium]